MTELIAAPAGQPRLALLIKSKIAHQAGYFLLNGRWHAIHQHKPAPKGVPVAAHPKAAHAEHVKPFPLPDDQVAQLKLPPENVNAGTYNKQLDSLLGYAANGDATAILGMNLGTNTYGKKLAKVANYLLEGMGVTEEYKVAPGQKAGEHHAVKQTPEVVVAKVETPAANEPVVEAAAVIEAAKVDEPAFTAYPSTGPLAMPAFIEGKTTTGVVDYYQKQAMKVIDAAESGDIEGLTQMEAEGTTPNGKGKISNTWAGKTPNSKLLLALHANAVESLGGGTVAAVAEVAPEVVIAEPAPVAVEAAVVAAPNTDLTSQIPWEKLSSPETKGDGTPNKEGINANKKLAAIKSAAESGDTAALEAMKFGVNTYGKKLNQAKAIALAALEVTPAAPEPVAVVTPPVTEPVTPTLAMQLADAKGPMGKMAVAEQHVVKNGKSAGTYKQIAEAHASLGNDESAEHWHSKASDMEAFDKLSDDIKASGSTTAATKAAVVHVIKNKHSVKASEQAIEALQAHGYDGAAKAIKMAMDEHLADLAKPVPEKPTFESTHWTEVSDSIESAISSGDIAKLQMHADTSEGLQSIPAKAVNGYAKAGLEYLGAGPKDGDTKPGANGGTLVFKDGRWHKQDEPDAGLTAEQKQSIMDYLMSTEATESQYEAGKALFKQLPEELKQAINAEALKITMDNIGAPAVAVHPLDAVPLPDLSKLLPSSQKKITDALEKLKEQAKLEGAGAFKGVLKKMSASGKLITKLEGEWGSFKIAGYEHSPEKPYALVHQYVEDLKAAAGGKKATKAKAKPSAGLVSVDPLAQVHEPIQSMDNWKQVGPQGGSNPGGKFVDPNGVEWYCKFPADEDMAKSEVLAAKLYGAAGIAGQDAKLITKDGKMGIASKWTDVSKVDPSKLSKADGVASGFAVDAWLGNWDVVGLGFDNLQVDADGKAMRVDAGGSLEYRAQGGKKTFGDSVLEIDSLRDSKINPQAAKVFGKLTEADITASVAKVLKVGNSQIYALVNAYGPGDAAAKKKLAETLIARKADLLAKYPKAKKEKVIVFKPENISAPPSFLNWGGSGASGPSSKAFLNEANEKAVQDIFETAKTGDIEAIKNLSADTFNKETGEVTGAAPVLEHPSQHVKGYAQQVSNEIHQQMNPPKRFRFDGGHPLHSLHYSYPVHKGALQGAAVKKIGEFVELGKADPISLESLALPKITYASGQLNQGTYSPQASKAIKQMPSTQKQAVKSYTGSSYKEMNQSLWKGNPTGAAKAADEALKTLGHDIAPGTVLSRKLSLSGNALNQLLGSTGKVLQEPAIMSTSIRPSAWGGNVHLKLHAGPGVKGLWVGYGSLENGGALSSNAGEDELVLPPNTRLLILSVKPSAGGDADGFGNGSSHIIEAVILPTEQLSHA